MSRPEYHIFTYPSTRTSVSEGKPAVFKIMRLGSTKSEGRVRFFTGEFRKGYYRAVDGKDFDGRDEIIYFRPGQKEALIYVNTRRNGKSRWVQTEYFNGIIKKVNKGDRISESDRSNFMITNHNRLPKNKSEYTISQANTGNTVKEGEKAIFRISRTGNINEPGKVEFLTSDSFAKASSDYQKKNQIVNFKPNQKFIDIEVQTNRDKSTEHIEMFWANLRRVNKGDVTGAKSYMYIKDEPNLDQAKFSIKGSYSNYLHASFENVPFKKLKAIEKKYILVSEDFPLNLESSIIKQQKIKT